MRISDWSSDVCSSDLFFGAYRHLAREELAFVYHYGDFIYEYSQDYLFSDGLPSRPVRKNAMRNLIDLSDFRTAYSQQLGDVDLQAARAMHAFLSSFDDHEIRKIGRASCRERVCQYV